MADQRSLQTADGLWAPPCRELLLTPAVRDRAKQLADDGRLSFAAAEVLRGKAVNLIAERVKVTDASGHPVDIKAALSAPVQTGSAEDDDDADDADDAAEVGPDDTDQA